MARFLCPKCPRFFNSRASLKTHLTSCSVVFKCEHCNRTFNGFASFSKHKRMNKNCENLKCFCGKQFKHLVHLKRHSKIHVVSLPLPVKCDKCGRIFPNSQSLKHHEQTNKICSENKCDICNKLFGTPSLLKYHMVVHSNDKKFECTACHKFYKYSRALKRHLNSDGHKLMTKGKANQPLVKIKNTFRNSINLKITKMKCSKCGNFICHGWFWTHVKSTCPQNKFIICSKCKKKFSKVLPYRRHFAYCGKRCKFCGMSNFPSLGLLRRHELDCPFDKKRTCKFCKKKFRDIKQKETHVRRFCVKREFNYQCPFCGNNDNFDSTDVTESLLHIIRCQPKQIERVKCYMCEKSQTPEHYSIHAQRELLWMRFFKQQDLIFECKVCKFLKFPSKPLLDEHIIGMKTATVLIPTANPIFKCIRCEVKLHTQEEMKQHSNEIHGIRIRCDILDGILLRKTNMATSINKYFPDFTCYLCKSPFYCQVVNKRHVDQCEKRYTMQDMENGLRRRESSVEDDRQYLSFPENWAPIGFFRTKSGKLKRKLTTGMAHKILTKLNEEMEDYFFKEMVGCTENLFWLAKKLFLTFEDLREWLGIENDLKLKEHRAIAEMLNVPPESTNVPPLEFEEDFKLVAQCRKCRLWFSTASDCIQHEEKCEWKFKCYICGLHFTLKSALLTHMNSYRKLIPAEPKNELAASEPKRLKRTFDCQTCHCSFPYPSRLKKHFKSRKHRMRLEEQSMWTEKVCSPAKPDTVSPTRFQPIPVKEPFYKCVRCEASTDTQILMQLHAKQVHGISIPSEVKGTLTKISKENFHRDVTLVDGKHRKCICYLCNFPFHNKEDADCHIKHCEVNFKIRTQANEKTDLLTSNVMSQRKEVQDQVIMSKVVSRPVKLIRVLNDTRLNRRHRLEIKNVLEKDISIFTPIFKCTRCDNVSFTNQNDAIHHFKDSHNTQIPPESQDWLDMLSEENKAAGRMKAAKYFCYLCHSSFYCKVANKRHINLCEQEYLNIVSDEQDLVNIVDDRIPTLVLVKH